MPASHACARMYLVADKNVHDDASAHLTSRAHVYTGLHVDFGPTLRVTPPVPSARTLWHHDILPPLSVKTYTRDGLTTT